MTQSHNSTRWRQFEGRALYAYHRLITRTSRWHFIGKANLTQARSSGRPVLWTMWHNQVMPFMMYGDRFEDASRFSIITVGDERGDTLMSLGEKIGAKMHAVDMQGSPVTAGRAVLRVMNSAVRIIFEDLLFTEESLEYLHEKFIDDGRVDELLLFVQGPNRSIEQMQLVRDGFEPELHVNSFMQINDEIREKLYEFVLSLPIENNEKIVDGYCGIGELTCRLAERFQTVIGVESHPNSAQDALEIISRKQLQNKVVIHKRNLEAFLFTERGPFKNILLNPPRAGLSSEARRATLQHSPTDLVIISCHPAALARDVSFFVENGYCIETIQAFDMFPQTYHYEAVSHLKKQ